MTVWSKLLSALRGGANEVGEAIVDSQALRILDQEIRDADVELRKSREALASIMARHRLAQERVEARQVAEYEQYAIKALEAGNEELAGGRGEDRDPGEPARGRACPGRGIRRQRSPVAQVGEPGRGQHPPAQATGGYGQGHRERAEGADGRCPALRQLEEQAADRGGLLERIKQRQAERAATMDAAAELASAAAPDDALDAKLRAAGIKASGNSVDGVLARLKGKA